MTDSEAKSFALFFYLSLLDERKAIQAVVESQHIYKKILEKKMTENNLQALVQATRNTWKKRGRRLNRIKATDSVEMSWLLPDELDLKGWMQIYRHCTEDELLALLWVYVLKIPISDVSAALTVSEGTLHYRIGRGLRRLGASL